MYVITSSRVVRGDVAAIWAVSADVARWPEWDPHEQDARLDGPFAVGARGWSKPRGGPGADWTLIEVEHGRAWGSACALPGGGLRGRSTFEALGGDRVRCTRRIEVTGPLVPLFRLWFGPRIRRDLDRTWIALEAEVARRAAV